MPDREMTQEDLEALAIEDMLPGMFAYARAGARDRAREVYEALAKQYPKLLAEIRRLRRVPASGERSEAVQAPDLERAIAIIMHRFESRVNCGPGPYVKEILALTNPQAPKGITEGGEHG